jgi:hypothetical protein
MVKLTWGMTLSGLKSGTPWRPSASTPSNIVSDCHQVLLSKLSRSVIKLALWDSWGTLASQ